MPKYYPEEITLIVPYERNYYHYSSDSDFDEVKALKQHEQLYKIAVSPSLYKHLHIAYGDIVKVTYENGEYFIDSLVEQSGYSSIHISIERKRFEEITNRLRDLQVEIYIPNKLSWYSSHRVILNIPPGADYASIDAYLGNMPFRTIYTYKKCIRKGHQQCIHKMDRNTFWMLIDETYGEEDRVTTLIERLKDFSQGAITDFERYYLSSMNFVDREEIRMKLEKVLGEVDDALFFHFRAWTISKGINFYHMICFTDSNNFNFIFSREEIMQETMSTVSTIARQNCKAPGN